MYSIQLRNCTRSAGFSPAHLQKLASQQPALEWEPSPHESIRGGLKSKALPKNARAVLPMPGIRAPLLHSAWSSTIATTRSVQSACLPAQCLAPTQSTPTPTVVLENSRQTAACQRRAACECLGRAGSAPDMAPPTLLTGTCTRPRLCPACACAPCRDAVSDGSPGQRGYSPHPSLNILNSRVLPCPCPWLLPGAAAPGAAQLTCPAPRPSSPRQTCGGRAAAAVSTPWRAQQHGSPCAGSPNPHSHDSYYSHDSRHSCAQPRRPPQPPQPPPQHPPPTPARPPARQPASRSAPSTRTCRWPESRGRCRRWR